MKHNRFHIAYLLIILFIVPFVNPNSQTGFIFGYNGTILKTTNYGTNWTAKNSNTAQTLWYHYFLNEQTGWVVGGTYSLTAIILKTTDAGETWSQQWSASGYWLTGVYFNSAQTGFAIGTGGTILKTTNSGTNWESISSPGPVNTFYETITFPNAATGWIIGHGGVILKSTTSGANWSVVPSGTTTTLYTLFFQSADTGFVAGSGGLLMKTRNGGLNWMTVPLGITEEIFSLFFMAGSGWLAGHHGTIMKTTDRGVSWSDQVSPGTRRLETVNFINANTGWIAGGDDGYVVLKTTDGGSLWSAVDVGVNVKLNDVYFFPRPIGITQISSEVPKDFMLNQNYPNPFNPATKIKFSVPAVGNAYMRPLLLTIYDALGREIETLVNENLTPGTYEVTWDGSAYPSGTYFYTLSAGDFKSTGKMVMIK